MEDEKIIALYFDRDERATLETDKKYGKYCLSIAQGILHDRYDAEECLNDTYFSVWNTIPPTRPSRFRAFLAVIMRRMSFDRYDKKRAAKRGGDEGMLLPLAEEYYTAAPDGDVLPCEKAEFKEQLNAFLGGLEKQARIIFLRRYFYCLSIRDIARDMRLTEDNVKVSLHRTRAKMKAYWETHM